MGKNQRSIFSNIKWGDLPLDPDPKNILAVRLTVLLTWASVQTRCLLIVLAGESAEMQGYVFFSEVQFIPKADLKAIDDLWRQHSNNRFGYSVQKRVAASSSSSPPLKLIK
ncbi:hypothetical protein M0R45_035797 [Rubus argutus]|uniref:GUN4-like domain-containing protein n=1 Tax=Rubus argutus TaxID=59490 RepID=A0AAW1VYR7_RUBAR